MSNLKYTVIKTKRQYNEYCNTLKNLDSTENVNRETEEEIELLTLLIENYDAVHNTLGEFAPIPLLKELMAERKMKATDLVDLLEISKGYVSDILNLRKGLSKDVIRKLAAHFHLHQEAFNRPYPLVAPGVKAAKTSKTTKHTKGRSSQKRNVAA
jgi:HTH-type transcriptional regulator / antitoxin HigA